MSVSRSPDTGLLIVLLLFGFLAVAALLINPTRTTYGLKSDEATYVTMALSIAHDADLVFQRRDLDRFRQVYRDYEQQGGPEGIFLKRGSWPHDRLYFGKAFIYPLVAAPFIRLAGLNGFLVLNVLLLAITFLCLYVYAVARMTPTVALLVSTGFLGASITPLFSVWMMPETFNMALVGCGYFCWLYKEVTARTNAGATKRLFLGSRSDLMTAVLLGLATFSKLSNLLLILPPIALACWRRRFSHGFQVGVVFALVVAAGFGTNGLISGELNYQGGDRKTFYGEYPFQNDTATFENLGIEVTTESLEFEGWQHLGRNTVYFLFGRHFGLLPYFFPAIVVIISALRRWRELRAQHALVAVAIVGTAMVLLFLLPHTWSGGGGPPANRYFLSIYPAFFFLIPAIRTLLPGIVMWVGGALFVAQILVNPFVAAKRPWQNSEQGLFRMLPVELTMVDDLPVQLANVNRTVAPFGPVPQPRLYYLDDNAWHPEESAIWVAGQATADVIVRFKQPISELEITVWSPINNTATLTVDGSSHRVELTSKRPVTVRAPINGVLSKGTQNFVLRITTENGFAPAYHDPFGQSIDFRYLGVRVRLAGITSHSSSTSP